MILQAASDRCLDKPGLMRPLALRCLMRCLNERVTALVGSCRKLLAAWLQAAASRRAARPFIKYI